MKRRKKKKKRPFFKFSPFFFLPCAFPISQKKCYVGNVRNEVEAEAISVACFRAISVYTRPAHST